MRKRSLIVFSAGCVAALLATAGPPVSAQAPAPAAAPAAAPPVERQPTPAAPAHGAPAAASHAAQPDAERGHAPAKPGGEGGHGAAAEHAADESHGESPWALIARFVNFAILVGGLAYVLKGPLTAHLQARRQQISGDIQAARATSAEATAQLTEIDRRLADLPRELEALRERGAEEVAGEEAAIRQRAEAERQRLLDQTRREIDLEVRLARRHLVEHTADLAVALAADRASQAVTDQDRERLLDRYLSRVEELRG